MTPESDLGIHFARYLKAKTLSIETCKPDRRRQRYLKRLVEGYCRFVFAGSVVVEVRGFRKERCREQNGNQKSKSPRYGNMQLADNFNRSRGTGKQIRNVYICMCACGMPECSLLLSHEVLTRKWNRPRTSPAQLANHSKGSRDVGESLSEPPNSTIHVCDA